MTLRERIKEIQAEYKLYEYVEHPPKKTDNPTEFSKMMLQIYERKKVLAEILKAYKSKELEKNEDALSAKLSESNFYFATLPQETRENFEQAFDQVNPKVKDTPEFQSYHLIYTGMMTNLKAIDMQGLASDAQEKIESLKSEYLIRKRNYDTLVNNFKEGLKKYPEAVQVYKDRNGVKDKLENNKKIAKALSEEFEQKKIAYKDDIEQKEQALSDMNKLKKAAKYEELYNLEEQLSNKNKEISETESCIRYVDESLSDINMARISLKEVGKHVSEYTHASMAPTYENFRKQVEGWVKKGTLHAGNRKNSVEFDNMMNACKNYLELEDPNSPEAEGLIQKIQDEAQVYLDKKNEQHRPFATDLRKTRLALAKSIIFNAGNEVKGIRAEKEMKSSLKEILLDKEEPIESAITLENKFNELETKNLATDKTNENKEVKQDNTTVIKDTTGPEITPKETVQDTTKNKKKKNSQKDAYMENLRKFEHSEPEEEHIKNMRPMLVEWASLSLGRSVNHLGDPDKIQKYMDENPDLNDIQVEHLHKRIASNKKIKQLKEKRTLNQKKRPSCMKDENGRILLNKKQNLEKQTSSQGCWSCVLSDMLAFFGVKGLNQQDVRFYRPEFRSDMINTSSARALVDRLSGDRPNELYDVADLIHNTVPNVAVHHMSIGTYFKENKKFMLEKIEDILLNKNSPIALCINGHFSEIVGLDGDKVLLQDSNQKYEGQYIAYKIDKLFGLCHGGQLSLDWFEDLEFTKSGRCKTITKNDKDLGIDCKDGEFSKGDVKYCSHVNGNEFHDGSIFATNGIEETIYMPKMAFEKELGLGFEGPDYPEDEIIKEIPQEKVEQEQTNDQPKLSVKEILQDAWPLARNEKLYNFADAMYLMEFQKKKADAPATYNDWSKDIKAKIPLDMMIDDFGLEYSKDELNKMPTDDLYDILEQFYDQDTYLSAFSLREYEDEFKKDEDEIEL